MAATFDARAYLHGLVGQTIPTITRRPNTIVAVGGDDVFVAVRSSVRIAHLTRYKAGQRPAWLGR